MKQPDIALGGQLATQGASQVPAVPRQKPAQSLVPAGDGLSDYLWKQLHGYGHVVWKRVNDVLGQATLLPQAIVEDMDGQRQRWKSIAIAVPIVAVFVLAGAKHSVTAWQEHRAQVEAQAKMAQMQQEQAVRAAAAAAGAKAYADAYSGADQKLLAFVTGVDLLPLDKTYANATDMSSPEAVASVQQALSALLAGQANENAKFIDAVGPWASPIVAKRLTDHSLIAGVAVREGDARKVLVLYAQRGQNGQADAVVGLRVPAAGVPERQFMADQQFHTFDFDRILNGQLREQFVRSFMPAPAPAAASSASTN